MSTYETIATIISGIALIVSITALIFSKLNTNKIEKIYYGQSETAIRQNIMNARNRLEDTLSRTKPENQYSNQSVKVAIEQLLNSYEEACAKYIDCKIDKERFRKSYFNEIKDIVECDDLKQYFSFGSSYDAIKKVYDEWFNLEK